jgi:diaminohydroxyphosphoribosylaminopyrimidine deaminase / 5-amino-6-(5-phosphoribosylamino)uracil reductase
MTMATPSPADYQAAMKRALELATKGPRTGPNPQVGCVLLDSSPAIVAEGWHEGAGTPHAEIMALTNLTNAGVSPRGLTAVVTLEPCAHTGKTGPCANALVDAGIARVVYSVSDSGDISGGGAQILRSAGVEVIEGIEESAGEALIERWLHSVATSRPWVKLKWAMSLDGRVAAADGTSQWITGEDTRAKVHRDRSEHDAIIVGINTVLVDNPRLTARTPEGDLYAHQPQAIVVGRRDVPQDALIRDHPGGFEHVTNHDLTGLLSALGEREIRSVYVEGGATLASAFLADNLVDELHITMGPMLLGGPNLAVTDLGIATMADSHHLTITDVQRLGDDIVVTARPHQERGH